MKAIPMFFVAMVLLLAGPASADPSAHTEALVKAFQAVKPIPEDGSDLTDADRKANTAAFATLDAFLDFDTLTASSIAAHKSKFKPEQVKKFSSEFAELIRLVAYPNSGTFFKKAKYKLKVKKKKGKRVDVEMAAYLEEEDIDTTVTFHWQDSATGLRLVDVSLDGDSLVKDYSNQFGRIINKAGVDDLLQRVSKRLKRERDEAIVAP